MIDLHCHLLPGIDDGPKTLQDSLALCKKAVANGINRAVTTPHIIPGRYDNDVNSINGAWQALKQELAIAGISLELGMAAEVRLDPVIMDYIKQDRVPFLGKYGREPLLLLEFPHTHIPPGSKEFVKWLFKEGIRPMIAHPERNGDVINSLKKIEPFVRAGCLLQVTAASLDGTFGDEPKKRAEQMLKKDWVTILASDAHNLGKRSPSIEPGRQVAAKIVGEARSWELVRDVPAEISKEHFEISEK